MDKISILIVDDHKLIRESWSLILNTDPRFEVIGEISSGEEAITFVSEIMPDIILMDVNMKPMSGFEASKEIRKISPDSKIIGVSIHNMPAYAKKMVNLGAKGYLTKNSSKEEMILAINAVSKGKEYICEEVKGILRKKVLSGDEVKPDLSILSSRELEVINLIRDGLSSKEIALQLNIALKTIEVHRYNILKKLKLKNTASLINFINEHGL